jgi:hypothetical protein
VNNFLNNYPHLLVILAAPTLYENVKKPAMIELIESTIQMLRERVQSNLARIKINQGQIRSILQEPVSDQRTGKFDTHYSDSKQLLKENQDLINLQINLVNFLEKYKKMINSQDPEVSDSPSTPTVRNNQSSVPANKFQPIRDSSSSHSIEIQDISDLFDKTIDGSIPWCSSHPMFLNETFYNQLMQYYLSVEDYEACDQLSRSRKV